MPGFFTSAMPSVSVLQRAGSFAALLPREGKRIDAARLPGQPAPRFMLPQGEYTYGIYE